MQSILEKKKGGVVPLFFLCLMNEAFFAFSADFVHAGGSGAESFGFTFGGA